MPLVKSTGSAAAEAPAPTVEVLLGDLQSPYPQLRRSAARKLADHPDAASALCGAVAVEVQESVREAIFTALIRIGTKPVAETLLPFLQSEHVGLRNGAIEVLKTMPDAVSEHIGDIFAGSRDVRIFGVEILGALAHPDAIRWLTRVIREDSDLNVCSVAVDALSECGDQTVVAPLLALLERFADEPFLEFSVRTALARIGAA